MLMQHLAIPYDIAGSSPVFGGKRICIRVWSGAALVSLAQWALIVALWRSVFG
jgi:hypothetical protein